MTDICRFDFSALWIAVFHCSAVRPRAIAIGVPISDRQNHLLSHDSKSVFDSCKNAGTTDYTGALNLFQR
jgi:hypothetical protein